MLIEWNERLEIGHPLIDSEHRYLIRLINNLYEQYIAGKLSSHLAEVFTHLAKYVHVHFENEEALMKEIGYPELSEHQEEHRKLIDQAINLSEKFMDGSETVTDETILFLQDWALHHISESDMKIKKFLKGVHHKASHGIPAFVDEEGPEFKKCSMCGKMWHSFEELQSDSDIELLGCMIDCTNHLYNLILFNCTCHTTLGMLLKEFIPVTDFPFVIEEHTDSSDRTVYCLKDEGEPCLEKCSCRYTSQILEALK